MRRQTIIAVGMLPPPMGGQALMFKRAIDGLSQYYDLRVIDIQFQKNLGESGTFSIRKSMHFFSLLFRKMLPLIFSRKVDTLYYCISGPSILGLIKDLVFLSLLRSRSRRTVYHFHGAGGIDYLMHCNAFLRAWARLVLFKPDLVLRPPGATVDEAAVCQAKREIVIYNAIEDPLQIIPEPVRKWPDKELSFTFVGAVTEDKGVFDLVRIARLLRDRGRRFTMSIVGQGAAEEVELLRRMITDYGLDHVVRLTGVLVGKAKFRLLKETTIYLFPTFFRAETQPTAIMEALALGVPVVASDWRAVSTMIDQGVNGYVVPPRDPEAFCQAVEKILNHGEIASLSKAARESFLERFTLDRHIEALRIAFQSLNHCDAPSV